jgi:hypothetical protein
VIGAYAHGKVDVGTLDPEKLPDDLAGLSKEQLSAELARRSADRTAAQKELGDLTKQRDAYLADQAKKGPSGGFDNAVEKTVDAELQ